MAKDFRNINNPALPLGIRNNNPGNLRPLGRRQMWVGQTGVNGGFAVFQNVHFGLRAMVKNALTHLLKRGNDTVTRYVNAYAPPHENDTRKYIQDVAKALGIRSNDRIPITVPSIVKLIRIQLVKEVGRDNSNLISDSDILEGIKLINAA